MNVVVDLRRPVSCTWWLERGFWLVVGSIVVGLFGYYMEKLRRLKEVST